MPYYDYHCQDCQKPARFFYSFAEYDTANPVCPSCDSDKMHRHIYRVSIAKSEDKRMDDMFDESAFSAMESEDPREIGRMMRKMGNEMGEELGDEFGEVVDRLEKGQSPDEIEQALPDLANETGGAGALNGI